MKQHDIHSFLKGEYDNFCREHSRIYNRTPEDPGTAGDQGEENWANFLRNWLPPTFQVVTKGRILFEDSSTSPQVDLLVLSPAYPKALLSSKYYLAGGVVAAFECKNTLKNEHISEAINTSLIIKRKAKHRNWFGTPFKEMNSPIFYGLLAHSHIWKNPKSTPIQNVTQTIEQVDEKIVQHPSECIDTITVADLGIWLISKTVAMGRPLPPGNTGRPTTAYICIQIDEQKGNDVFTPIGGLLKALYTRLSWEHPEMRSIDHYFSQVSMTGSGQGTIREWPYHVFSSNMVQAAKSKKLIARGDSFSEWQAFYML